MASTYQLWLGGAPVSEDMYDRLSQVEVEENADLPGAIQVRMPLSRNDDGDLSPIDDAGLQPLAKIAVVATADGKPPECIFDGYVLSQKMHVETGVTASHVDVYGQDASWLMNLDEKTREWADVTDGTAANTIFGEYGITPSPQNLSGDSPMHTESGHTLMQRATDIEFLRALARRTGKWCRVACTAVPGIAMGIFAVPSVDGEPAATLRPNDPAEANVTSIDIEWDVMRPTSVRARQALFTDSSPTGAMGDASESGIAPLDERDLTTFAGRPMTAMLTAPVDDAGELRQRAEAVLRDAGWFVRCTGEADAAAVRTVLRVGQIVQIETMGNVHSGKYLVWSVRHRITADSHKMRFVLVRNAVGAPGGGAGGLLGGLL